MKYFFLAACGVLLVVGGGIVGCNGLGLRDDEALLQVQKEIASQKTVIATTESQINIATIEERDTALLEELLTSQRGQLEILESRQLVLTERTSDFWTNALSMGAEIALWLGAAFLGIEGTKFGTKKLLRKKAPVA